MSERPSNVVDFLEFRAARERGRLPLFDGVPQPLRTLPDLTERPLSTAAVEHRARMLKHLGARPEALRYRLVD